MRDTYYDSIMLIERLHRLFLDVVKQELEHMGVHEINNVQAMLIYNIGDSELSIGELSTRGYYMATNVSYNLRKLVDYGYLVQSPSPHDKRSSMIRVGAKGLELHQRLHKVLKEHNQALAQQGLTPQSLTEALSLLRQLEQIWVGLMTRQKA